MNNNLQERRRVLEEELSEQISEVSEKAKDVGKQALIIAGGVFVAYQLVKLMTKSKKGKKCDDQPKQVYHRVVAEGQDPSGAETIIIKEAKNDKSNVFWEELKAEFGAMLLGLVKAKIYEALENFNKDLETAKDKDEA